MTTTTAELQTQYDDPWDALADMRANLEEKDERIDDLEATLSEHTQTIDQQDERIEELERELDNQATNVTGAFTKLGEIDDRLADVEHHDDDSSTPVDKTDQNNDEQNPNQTQTPLETICALPEHIAARELTANQERARFIATDVRDYAEKAPAGLIVDSRAIKRVIAAKEGDRPHTQTVARVMEFLDRLGKGAVELRNRRGRKLVAIDPEAADRLSACAGGSERNHDRCDQGRGTTPTGNVIG